MSLCAHVGLNWLQASRPDIDLGRQRSEGNASKDVRLGGIKIDILRRTCIQSGPFPGDHLD